MQKKVLATLISSAFAGAAGVAQAGPISVASVTTYATEAVSASSVILTPSVAYSLTNPIAGGSTVIVRLSLDAGSVGGCPALSFSGLAGASVATTIAGSVSGASSCDYTVAVGVGPAIPSNATANFAAGGTVTGLGGALGVNGGLVSATVAVRDLGGNTVESNSGVVARSANAWAVTVTPSSSFTTPVTTRIDVGATPPASGFTGTGVTAVNLGRIRITETAGTQVAPNGSTEVNFANAQVQTISLTVTGAFGASTATLLTTDTTCAAGTVATFTAGTVSAINIDNTAVPPAGSNKDLFVCYVDQGAAVIPTAQFAVSTGAFSTIGTVAGSAVFTTSTSVAGALYNLTLNGSQIDIRNYVPNNTFGWVSAYRIINTGTIAAAVTGQVIAVDGTVGTATAITAAIPAGGVVVVSAAQVEAALGAITATGGVGPRLRLTAPTNGLRVQAFACQPNGNCFLNTDAQASDNGGADR